VKIAFTLRPQIKTKPNPLASLLSFFFSIFIASQAFGSGATDGETNNILIEIAIKWATGAFGLAATIVGIVFTFKKFNLENRKLDFEKQKYKREQWKEKQHVYLSARKIAGSIALGNLDIFKEDGKNLWNEFVDCYHQARTFFDDGVMDYLGIFYWKIDEYLTSGENPEKRIKTMEWFDEQIGKIQVGSKGMGPLDDIFRPHMGLGDFIQK